MIEHKLDLNLRELVSHALKSYDDSEKTTALTEKIISFSYERFKFLLKDEFRHDFIAAVIPNGNIYSSYQRVVALKEFHDSDKGKEVFAIFHRIANFIPASYAKSDSMINPKLFSDDLEKKLYEAVDQVSNELKDADVVGGFSSLSKLVEPLNNFCDKVTVMSDDENVKINRINLLRSVQNSVSNFGIDFSVIEF